LINGKVVEGCSNTRTPIFVACNVAPGVSATAIMDDVTFTGPPSSDKLTEVQQLLQTRELQLEKQQLVATAVHQEVFRACAVLASSSFVTVFFSLTE
jgi:hypothetical protein